MTELSRRKFLSGAAGTAGLGALAVAGMGGWDAAGAITRASTLATKGSSKVKLPKAIGALHVSLASEEILRKVTGTRPGFVGPLSLLPFAENPVFVFLITGSFRRSKRISLNCLGELTLNSTPAILNNDS